MKNGSLKIFRLKNSKGTEMVVSNYGATIIALKVRDKDNNLRNVVVGLDSAEAYTKKPYSDYIINLGCLIGRYAGRISKGYFEIDGEKYPIYHEDGVHMHGGLIGFDRKYWETKTHDKYSVTLNYTSKHLEEGYPGNLKVQVRYELTERNALKVVSTATTDRPTILNLTNHSYFNLNGSGSILGHQLQLPSNQYLELDSQTLPTGRLLEVDGTKYDYRKTKPLRSPYFDGLDDIFVRNDSNWMATIKSGESGIAMKVSTNQPAVVVCAPKTLPKLAYAEGAQFGQFPAICFETQNFPDAPHHETFPSSLLLPGEVYKNESTFEFSNDL